MSNPGDWSESSETLDFASQGARLVESHVTRRVYDQTRRTQHSLASPPLGDSVSVHEVQTFINNTFIYPVQYNYDSASGGLGFLEGPIMRKSFFSLPVRWAKKLFGDGHKRTFT